MGVWGIQGSMATQINSCWTHRLPPHSYGASPPLRRTTLEKIRMHVLNPLPPRRFDQALGLSLLFFGLYKAAKRMGATSTR